MYCLNPYSNGILPDSTLVVLAALFIVLILILMEYSLTFHLTIKYSAGGVLILILMEYSLTMSEEE